MKHRIAAHRRSLLGHALCWCVGAAACQVPITSAAQAQARLQADVDVGVVSASNPFSLPGGDTASFGANLSFRPSLTASDARSVVRLDAAYDRTEYARFYRPAESIAVGLTAQHRFDARMSLKLSGRIADRNASRAEDLFRSNGNPIDAPIEQTVLDDVLLSGARTRTVSYRTDVGLKYDRTAVDQITFDFATSAVRFPGNTAVRLSEYNYVSQSMGYRRKLTPRLSLGATLALTRSDYLGTDVGDGSSVLPQMALELRLGSRVSVVASAGLALTRTNVVGGEAKGTYFAGDLKGCWSTARQRLCLSAARSALPSSLDGIRIQTGLTADYSHKLSARTTLRADARYTRASEPLAGGAIGLVTFASVGGSIERRSNERLTFFVAARYDSIIGGLVARGSNHQISAGVRVRIGRVE